jgi:hypothetical protein
LDCCACESIAEAWTFKLVSPRIPVTSSFATRVFKTEEGLEKDSTVLKVCVAQNMAANGSVNLIFGRKTQAKKDSTR